MNKSPEEYFQEQNFSAVAVDKTSFSPAEQAFMDKYLGMDGGVLLEKLGINAEPSPEPSPDQHVEMRAEESLDNILRAVSEIQMVAFFLGAQEFTVPTVAVQEVIRSMPLVKLPVAPEYVAGVINLRGKITPLIHLRDMLEVHSPRLGEDKFIIVCRRQGLQVGMIIERVHTMYRVPQTDIDWGIESHMGINVDFVAGLLKLRDQLVGIVSVDRIIASIIK
ncbi:MAG: chemotaxis protein CheW [Desulfovibrio sp.]|jgi:purine-binding chemotaxis protein CheW|nr:chemotaxis protein CheW [Desulfovibrio sp.]